MFDLATIASAIPAALAVAKESVGIAKGIRDLTSDMETKTSMSELLDRLIDTQTLILDAHGKMQEISTYTREVETQLAEYRQWDVEASRYELVEPYPGTFIYAKKAGLPDNEPMHHLCPKCFQSRQKTILQDGGSNGVTRQCHPCNVYYQCGTYPRTEVITGGGTW